MSKMQELMKDPEAMKNWFESKKNEFDALADDQEIGSNAALVVLTTIENMERER